MFLFPLCNKIIKRLQLKKQRKIINFMQLHLHTGFVTFYSPIKSKADKFEISLALQSLLMRIIISHKVLIFTILHVYWCSVHNFRTNEKVCQQRHLIISYRAHNPKELLHFVENALSWASGINCLLDQRAPLVQSQ